MFAVTVLAGLITNGLISVMQQFQIVSGAVTVKLRAACQVKGVCCMATHVIQSYARKC